jgi:hypothetical protein
LGETEVHIPGLGIVRAKKKIKRKKDKITQAVRTPHINKGKGATLVPSTVKFLHHCEKEGKINGIKRVENIT